MEWAFPHELSGIDLAIDDGLDETALLKFGCLMVWRDLKRKSFDDVGISPFTRGLLMQDGNLIDATIIAIAAVYHEFQKGS
ncbi:hypothetical protein WJ95_04765 [Burkholderia ubonensis]|uniref:hypothetical protein n=1 Tax=Burkholderia ubonensis TaxID=101571 RepID=UPI0007545B21|nr:hypothetical protein [Burkholderia ubonensis]KVP93802.1 hypothetical protein WJ95_04765 [Burkholderia ubonensis]KVT01385.1 hypothetical protein WK46_18140 [Burkholderia ubonensis]KVT15844.1 hypothetical protein WK47_30490 [Burkholderia ubonensis]KVT32062.1 hypothetical protein WK50_06990 [Burkholderia ubonensis]KVT35641.1 hypothetical protein WK48_04820 [Burkholderia ubonensis]